VMSYIQELSFRLGKFFAGTGRLLENPTVSLLRIIHTNEVYYIVPCSELASTTTITTQSCVDGTVPLSIPLPAKAKCNVVNNQRARDANNPTSFRLQAYKDDHLLLLCHRRRFFGQPEYNNPTSFRLQAYNPPAGSPACLLQ
jgi:hypothetical protein